MSARLYTHLRRATPSGYLIRRHRWKASMTATRAAYIAQKNGTVPFGRPSCPRRIRIPNN